MSITWMADGVGYVPGPVNVGVVRLEGDRALLIDTGLAGQHAHSVLRDVRSAGLTPHALLVTHGHTDHLGGAPAMRQDGLELVAASTLAAPFVRFPRLVALTLVGGAVPPQAILRTFHEPVGSPVDLEVGPGPFELPWESIAGELELFELGGHAIGQLGLMVRDVVFVGDAVASPEVWAHRGWVYHADVGGALESIRRLRSLQCTAVVAGHAVETQDPQGLFATNSENLVALSDKIENLVRCNRPRVLTSASGDLSTEDVVSSLISPLARDRFAFREFFVARATAQAHLSYLADEARIAAYTSTGRLLWSHPPTE